MARLEGDHALFTNINDKYFYAMNVKELLIQEIEKVPDFLLEEVLDFVHFLKAKHRKEKLDISIMSEYSLRKDWLRPEEDEAWQDL